jgi:hypothetical protein
MTQFPQSTIREILDSEREMVLTAPRRYGSYYETALDGSILMTHFLKIHRPGQVDIR